VRSPRDHEGNSTALHLEVVDVDHTYARAVEEGAEGQRPPADQGHGNRNATLLDPFGHRWMLSQPLDAERTAAAEQDSGVGGDGSDWKVTGRTPVEPGYITMRTTDLSRARGFFGALFAWQVEAGSQEGGGHVANTHFPMGFMEGAEGAEVTLYFRVDDIEPYAARVAELGGEVLSRNEYPSGGNAECVDDQGFRFDLFQPSPGY
jgi:predicted enzyme related to lactoylglutathione lyase